MSKINVLFIGGPKNKLTMRLDKIERTIYLPRPSQSILRLDGELPPDMLEIKLDTYVLYDDWPVKYLYIEEKKK